MVGNMSLCTECSWIRRAYSYAYGVLVLPCTLLRMPVSGTELVEAGGIAGFRVELVGGSWLHKAVVVSCIVGEESSGP